MPENIYSTSMTSLCIIIQHHTINQCTWLLGKKPSHKQEWMPSLQIKYAKRGCIDKYSRCDGIHFGGLCYIFPRPNTYLASRIRTSNKWIAILLSSVHRSTNGAITRFITGGYQIHHKLLTQYLVHFPRFLSFTSVSCYIPISTSLKTSLDHSN